jgi:hypothetical protein
MSKKRASFKRILIARSKADPFRKADYGALVVFAPILAGMADDGWKACIGKGIAEIMAENNADQLKIFFDAIVEMKRNIESDVNERSNHAVAAYFRFQKEHERNPSKLDLKKFIVENPKVYPGFPKDIANTEWTRIWKNADMNHFPGFAKC